MMVLYFYLEKPLKYLYFIVKEHKPKTNVVAVVNIKSQEEIGEIRWYSPWRQYCFFPYGNTIWNTGCLNDINDMISNLNPKPKTQHIAVVAHDVQDFLNWKHKRRHKETGTIRRYKRGNTEYICMTKPEDSHGYCIDKVIETSNAYLNPKIQQIMQAISYNMNVKKN